MTIPRMNSFGTLRTLKTNSHDVEFYSLRALETGGWPHVGRLPVSLRILLENVLRHEDGRIVTARSIEALLALTAVPLNATGPSPSSEIPFRPARVILQDFTGVPAVVDLAAMRDAMVQLGGDPHHINPRIPVDLVIDHSVQVDAHGSPDALRINEEREYERNGERYSLLRWAQETFRNFRVIPPGRGIVHQINLEYLASVVTASPLRVASPGTSNGTTAFPDTVVGTDSHTTMINGLGVLGWGVGGIEAEAVMLGQPYFMPLPAVVGVKLEGVPSPGITATDLVLHLTELLRAHKVVGKFVEFFGPGVAALSVPDRATLANMAPEYGATVGFFPIDGKTLDFLRLTGRASSHVDLVETYAREQGLFLSGDAQNTPLFADVVTLDLSSVEPSLAGPKRPQDRIPLREAAARFRNALGKPPAEWGFGLTEEEQAGHATVDADETHAELTHGSVVIAAITSCTNTSNPAVMLAAGLLARNAAKRGLRSRPWVKASLTPGSRVVTDYLKEAGLLDHLETLGFHVAGYGCTTCIGNSGPLPAAIQKAIDDGKLVAAAVLSGNRNFEGRIHAAVRANYLASPPLVVAYALSGRMTQDWENEPLGTDPSGAPVFLKDIWPSNEEVNDLVRRHLHRDQFEVRYGAEVSDGGPLWKALPVPEGLLYAWDPRSAYIRRPPFLDEVTETKPVSDITNARVLLFLGDSVTTDHISPAGAIPPDSPAGRYLQAQGIAPADFNSYGSRRGNYEVMMRGTFAHPRLRNILAGETGGPITQHFPSGEPLTVWDASRRYAGEGVPLLVLAGKEYGTGSSRDWAAKGTALLGIRAVLAESYERIHRSNLVGMGVLPLQFSEGASAASLGLTGREIFSVQGIEEALKQSGERPTAQVTAVHPDGRQTAFSVLVRLDTPVEAEYYRHGGILSKVLREMTP